MNRNLAAGLLMCRMTLHLEFFLVHPGGPYFRGKDAGRWTIPRGIPESEEILVVTACREFYEETGIHPWPPYFDIGTIKQKDGKVVHAWTFAGKWDPAEGISCNTFDLEWPPRSGKVVSFPEVDQARWTDYQTAAKYIIPEQIAFLDRAQTIFTKPKIKLITLKK